MIIYQRYCCVCMSIFVFHSSSITQNVYKKIKIYTTKYKLIVLSIQPLKELAFRTSPVNNLCLFFLSLLENDERYAEWNTTIILFTLEHAFKAYKIYGTYMLQRKGALSTLP